MSVEQRLHRAAHELREVGVETPEFVAPPSSPAAFARVAPAIAACFLVAAGGLGVVATNDSIARPSVPSAASAISAEPAHDRAVDVSVDDDGNAPGLTPHEEIAMIASLSQSIDVDPASGEPGVVEFDVPERAS